MDDDPRPIFQRIADDLTASVIAGAYPEGSQVPSTTELSRFHRINIATVTKGVNLLVDRGVLEKRRGIGMFVREGARQTLLSERRQEFRDRHLGPLLAEAQALGITADQLHTMIDQEGIL